jgi:hypothetical protein
MQRDIPSKPWSRLFARISCNGQVLWPRLQDAACLALLAIALIAVNRGFLNSQHGALAFFYNRNDFFMDFFNTLHASNSYNTYRQGNVYPPILLVILRKLFGLWIADIGPFVIRDRLLILGLQAVMLTVCAVIAAFHAVRRDCEAPSRANFLLPMSLGILVLCCPFSVFLFDRLNLILVPVLLFSWMAFLAVRQAANHRSFLLLTAWIAAIIKPYFLLSLLSIRLTAINQPFRKKVLLIGIDFLAYIILNQLAFVRGLYAGSGLDWPRNILGFSRAISPLSLNWDMSHYSVAPLAVVKALPYASQLDFLDRWSAHATPHPAMLMAATAITLFLIIIVTLCSLAIIWTARQCTIGLNGQSLAPISQAVAAIVAALAPIFLLLIVQKQIGYYTAALIWALLLLAAAFASTALRWCLACLLAAMAVLGGLKSSAAIGIASLALYWTVCLLSLHIILLHLRNRSFRANVG